MRKKVMRKSYKVTGYRVQAFAGGNSRNDRLKAEQTGNQLKVHFPEQPVYVHFYSPRWICRMGNFRSCYVLPVLDGFLRTCREAEKTVAMVVGIFVNLIDIAEVAVIGKFQMWRNQEEGVAFIVNHFLGDVFSRLGISYAEVVYWRYVSFFGLSLVYKNLSDKTRNLRTYLYILDTLDGSRIGSLQCGAGSTDSSHSELIVAEVRQTALLTSTT
jgi:hypothetical protein